MTSIFKFFQKNPYKNKCRLEIGSTFILSGNYCTVTKMYQNHFEYWLQETEHTNSISYKDYLTTPSAAGRQLNQ